MQLDPDLQSARLNLSGVYIQMGDYPNAARHAQILVDDPTFPTPWRALTNLGWAQLRTGQEREARRNLELAISYHPRYWPALLNLGILEAGEGRRLEAIAYFQRVVEQARAARDRRGHYRIAETLIALGQQEKAFRHLAAVTESSRTDRGDPSPRST
jgi:tetratricopeptide (TPR) repeat protein